jgi:hypothetical protein
LKFEVSKKSATSVLTLRIYKIQEDDKVGEFGARGEREMHKGCWVRKSEEIWNSRYRLEDNIKIYVSEM